MILFMIFFAGRNVDKDEGALIKNVFDLRYYCKRFNLKDYSRLGADANKFSLLDHFGIPVENLQTLQFLFQELKQLFENKKEALIISTSAAQEWKKEAYVQLQVGYSNTSLHRFGKSVQDMVFSEPMVTK